MSATRHDLHRPDHDQWDQGGYCNNLVVDDDGTATVCGYRKPLDPEPWVWSGIKGEAIRFDPRPGYSQNREDYES